MCCACVRWRKEYNTKILKKKTSWGGQIGLGGRSKGEHIFLVFVSSLTCYVEQNIWHQLIYLPLVCLSIKKKRKRKVQRDVDLRDGGVNKTKKRSLTSSLLASLR